MSPGLAPGEGEGVGQRWNCMFSFWEFLLGGANVE